MPRVKCANQKIQACNLEYKSVEGVALRKESSHHGSPLAAAHRGVASGAAIGNGLGAGDGRSGGEQRIELGLGEGIRQDEGPVLHAASAENDAGQDLVHCAGRLPTAHVGGGAVGARDGHWTRRWL